MCLYLSDIREIKKVDQILKNLNPTLFFMQRFETYIIC